MGKGAKGGGGEGSHILKLIRGGKEKFDESGFQKKRVTGERGECSTNDIRRRTTTPPGGGEGGEIHGFSKGKGAMVRGGVEPQKGST